MIVRFVIANLVQCIEHTVEAIFVFGCTRLYCVAFTLLERLVDHTVIVQPILLRIL